MLHFKHAEKCFNTTGTLCFPDFLLKGNPREISWILWCFLIPAEIFFFPGGWRRAGPAELPVQRVLFQKSTPSPMERSDPIRLPSGGRGGGNKDASFPALGAAGQECKSKFKPGECCARFREFVVPLSRSLQYLRELPNGMCGIHVIYLMCENWFLLSLLWCLRQKYFWFPYMMERSPDHCCSP